jgi:hypothetical protein
VANAEPARRGFRGSFLFVSRRAGLGTTTARLAEFYGGVRYGGVLRGRHVSPVFQSVELRIYSSGLRIGGRFRRTSLLVPLWEARFDELAEIWESSWALKFVASGEGGGRVVTFWGSRACIAQVAAVLRRCGLVWTDEEGVAADLRYRPRQ